MKRALILAIVGCLIFISCQEENVISSYLWSPGVEAQKGNGKVNLLLSDPRPLTNFVAPGPSDPDYFDVMISEDLENFSFYKKIDISTTEVLINELNNGKPYYFLVVGNKRNFNPLSSDTVMSVPSPTSQTEPFLPNAGFSVENLSSSPDLNYISFNSNDYSGNSGNYYGTDALFYRSNSAGTIDIIEKNAYGTDWSGTTNRLVYLITTLDDNTWYPFKLKIFNPETGLSATLLNIDYDKYYVRNPSYMPDGEMISFMSTLNNSSKSNYDIWTIDPETQKRTKVTDFENNDFSPDGNYDWTSDGEDIYLDGRYNIKNTASNIYKVNVATQIIEPVIESQWDDRSPTLSPDNTKLAFISNRSGKNELWVYDLENAKYNQVSGGTTYYFNSRYTNLQWLSNKKMLITVSDENEQSVAIKINVD